MDYKQEIKKLVQLQLMDAGLYDVRARCEVFPLRLAEMDRVLESKKGALSKAEDDQKKLLVAKNQKEVEMQSKEELIKKHQGQLFQIKNNKEYTALQQEIQNIKADVSKIEEEILNFFDKIDSGKALCEREKKAFEEEKKLVEAEKLSIKAEEKVAADELQAALARRETCIAGIDATILSLYQRILKSRGRVALAKLNGEFCGECGMMLRAQIINETKLKREPVICENCSRMLYSEE